MGIDTVNDLPRRVQYVASVGQTEADYTFPIFADADVAVDVDGELQALSTDYTVSGAGDDTGGVITFIVPLAGGEIVTLYSELAFERTTDFQQNGPWGSESTNDQLDRLTLFCRELKDKINRCIRWPFTAIQTSEGLELSPIADWYGKVLRVSSTGLLEAADLVSDVVALSADVIGLLIHPRSAAEIAAGVTPTRYWFDYGDIRRYGTNTTPGTTNMTAALASALSVSASHPTRIQQEAYLVTAALTVPARGRLVGDGRNSIIQKGFNGDVFTAGAMSEFLDFYVAGVGATFTGRGFVVSDGALDETSWRRWTRVSIIDMAGHCIEFTQATAGYASMMVDCRMTTTDQVVEAVKCPDTEANNGNRFMVDCWTFGTPLAHFGGCDNMSVVGCQGAYPTFTADTKKVNMNGCRIVQNGPGSRVDWLIKGTNITITGVVSGVPTITFNNECFKVTFRGNSVASGTTYVDTSRGVTDGNLIDIPHATYTPTWTGAGGNPAIVSGFLGGAIVRDGDYAEVNVRMTAAADTTFGTGVWSFTVPYAAARKEIGSTYILDTGTAFYAVACVIEADATTVRIVVNGAALGGAAVPHAWATGDELIFKIRYPIK